MVSHIHTDKHMHTRTHADTKKKKILREREGIVGDRGAGR